MKAKKKNEEEVEDTKVKIENLKGTESTDEEIPAEQGAEDIVAKLEKEKQELHDQLLRKMAEFENYKRRTENDYANVFKYAAEPFMIEMLPVYNDLERSLSHINDENKDSLIQGLKMVFNKFGKILENNGVQKIDAKGKEFDFNYHEALMKQESADVPPDTVLEVFENGYLYKDKVIKHAKVIVSSSPVVADESKEVQAEDTKIEEAKS